jgi:hypothetical protein
MEPGGAEDRFIHSFYRFWEKVKKLDFSMSFQGDQKTRKIDPWSAEGSKNAPPTNNQHTDRSPGGSPPSRRGIN